ncbi:hypothetical protein GCM10012275_54380 [Longimycelium tulufanense]|uniref:Lysozyme n=1 Tax=Longimycelium tulufanense TaxID=907463 RepID=A0A8J3FXV2_9PSEU|nr:glycoside hydrolase family 25 protein [Longimycelium tulufanense]GGM76844.1 hypothetical protein GCM10012275_54380 [Longimycelium tulufanense]
MARGIDVSSHQGHPNWAAVRGAGIEFAYIKATEGVGYLSPTLDSQYHGARAAGLVVGLYHFARPDTGNPPSAEADTFADQVLRLGAHGPGYLPPCLDIELTGENLRTWCGAFVARLRQRLGRHRVMVYASTNFLLGHLGEPWADANDIWWWVAHYGRPTGQPGHATPRVVMHQYTSTGQVPGIAGNVDMNALTPDQTLLSLTQDLENDMFTDDDRRRLQELYEWWQHGIEGIRHAGDHYLHLVRNSERTAALQAAVAGLTPTDPAAVAQALRPELSEVIRDVLGEDNTAQADTIVDKLAERLRRVERKG